MGKSCRRIALAKFGGRDAAPVDGRVRVTLSANQSAAMVMRSRATSRPTDELVAEAVERYLAQRADR